MSYHDNQRVKRIALVELVLPFVEKGFPVSPVVCHNHLIIMSHSLYVKNMHTSPTLTHHTLLHLNSCCKIMLFLLKTRWFLLFPVVFEKCRRVIVICKNSIFFCFFKHFSKGWWLRGFIVFVVANLMRKRITVPSRLKSLHSHLQQQ